MDHNQASLLEYEDVARVLQSHLSAGLTAMEARDRLNKYGLNKLNGADQIEPKWSASLMTHLVAFGKQFMNPLIQLLCVCVFVSAAIGEYSNSISVTLAILIVCSISYAQERRADKSLEKLTKQMPNTCKVLRDNQVHEIDASFLVPGDIIYLQEGQRVPADVRLFDLRSLTIDESNLTGEQQSQAKHSDATGKKLTSALKGSLSGSVSKSPPHLLKAGGGVGGTFVEERELAGIFQNLALMGTLVESGHSRGIVICTGNSTRYGEVYSMLCNTQQPKSPLQQNIDQLSIQLVVCACCIIACMSIVGIMQKRQPLEVVFYALSLAVTAIPEGLPVVVAVIMALGVIRLSKQKTIVKSLNSMETLGCVQVLCADKTGTLTRTDMTLTDIVTSELHSVSSSELEELNNEECMRHMTFNKFGGKLYSIGRLMEVGTLCNNASIDPCAANGVNLDDNNPQTYVALNRGYIGQATECAILDAALRLGFGDSRTKFQRISEEPFNSITRRMVVQCQRRDLANNSPMYYVKGAWEEILNLCGHYYECGLVRPKTDEMWCEYARVCTTLGSQGLRVLALATGPSMDQLNFVGVVGIQNALREGIVETVSRMRNNFHIDVKMITGDSRPTAVAMGRALGLLDSCGSVLDEDQWVMSGDQLQKLLNTDVDQQIKSSEILSKSIFYRVDPCQKANIVGKLQELNRVVAMTGDGINDVVSLKRANLSLVMGSGADVCKEIADVILLEDNLSVLLEAIVEGKGIYHKIQNFMAYQMSISLALVVLIAISFAAKLDPPFTVTQLLFINILADGPPAQSLGMERISERELCLWPRDVSTPILSCRLAGTLLILTTTLIALNGGLYYFLIENTLDGPPAGTVTTVAGSDTVDLLDHRARALLFSCFVFCTVFSALSLKSKHKTFFETRINGNKELLACCLIVVLLQVAFVQIDGLNGLLDLQGGLAYWELAYVFLYSSLILFVMDGVKIAVRLMAYTRQKIKHRLQ